MLLKLDRLLLIRVLDVMGRVEENNTWRWTDDECNWTILCSPHPKKKKSNCQFLYMWFCHPKKIKKMFMVTMGVSNRWNKIQLKTGNTTLVCWLWLCENCPGFNFVFSILQIWRLNNKIPPTFFSYYKWHVYFNIWINNVSSNLISSALHIKLTQISLVDHKHKKIWGSVSIFVCNARHVAKQPKQLLSCPSHANLFLFIHCISPWVYPDSMCSNKTSQSEELHPAEPSKEGVEDLFVFWLHWFPALSHCSDSCSAQGRNPCGEERVF